MTNVKLTKSALSILDHLFAYGGSIIHDHDECVLSWGSLLKNNVTKWHNRRMTFNTFMLLMPYLKILDEGLDLVEYELNSAGYKLAEGRKSAPPSQPGVGGGGSPDDAGTTESGKRQATKPDYGPVTKAIYHLEDELKALYRRGWITLGQFENADSAIDDFCEAINDKKAAQS